MLTETLTRRVRTKFTTLPQCGRVVNDRVSEPVQVDRITERRKGQLVRARET